MFVLNLETKRQADDLLRAVVDRREACELFAKRARNTLPEVAEAYDAEAAELATVSRRLREVIYANSFGHSVP